MNTLFAVVFLVAPSALGAYIYIYNWGGRFSLKDNPLWNYGNLLAVFAFVLYVLFVAFTGHDGMMEIWEFRTRGHGLVRAYLYPSIGYSLAIFPQVVKEFVEDKIGKGVNTPYFVFSIAGWLAVSGQWFIIIYRG